MSNTIQEQGPNNYTAMQERLEAARKADGAPREQAAADERSSAEVTRLVANLTGDATPLFVPSETAKGCFHVGKTCKEALCWGAGLPVGVPVVADVENDGDRGPRPSVESLARRTFANEFQAFVASAPLDDVRVLAAMVRELPGLRLLATCEAFTARGLRPAGESEPMPATTLRETMVASMLSTWRLYQRGVLAHEALAPGEKPCEWPASHLPRRTPGDYIHGRVALPTKDGAK